MTIPVVTANNVQIYNVTGCNFHRLPDWIVRKHAKKLKKDAEFSRRVQLIQDFEFPEASLRLAFTRDMQHIVATGVYKPQFRVFDLAEATLKFERHTTAENVAIQLLGDDWKKMALLQNDRCVEFHTPLGLYHSARIPKMGRDMIYDSSTCDMLVAASSSELYRLNLDRGQFLAPLETAADAVNCVRIAPLHGLIGLGCDNGGVEFWDRRDRRRLGALHVSRAADFAAADAAAALEVTALTFLPNGVHWAAGTSDGRVLLFDLRSSRPLAVRDHYNGFPIRKIEYHAERSLIVSADKRSIRLWGADTGGGGSRLFTTIESEGDINDFVLQPATGLILAANEGSPMSAYFIPSLGPAPRWCSFLESLTEEMEEGAGTGAGRAAVYENFKFVTRPELAQLGLDHLVGSKLLKAYMHGFFIDLRLYEKAKAIANPFAYEEYLARKKQEKLDRERQSRIRVRDPAHTAKVNKALALKLVRDREEGEGSETPAAATTKQVKNKRRAQETAKALLQDDRFTQLFNDPDFEIDQDSADYRALHPAARNKSTQREEK